MNPRLQELLQHLSGTLTIEREQTIESLHRRAQSWEPVERLPLIFSYPAPGGRFAPYPHAEALASPETMLYNELVSAFGTSICHRELVGDDLPCTIRPNFGTGVVASLFGARVELHGDDPPWVRPFETAEAFDDAIATGGLDYTRGWVPQVVERYACYRSVLASYPELAVIIKQVLPDMQGPLDTVELLRGSELYVDCHSEPERVERALECVAGAQVHLARHLQPHLTGSGGGWSHQHGFTVRGNVLIRVDSAILLSARMYGRMVRPHDERVLRELGGGGLHACGKMEHLAAEFLGQPDCRCVDLGQPHLNNLDAIYALARERKVPLLRLSVSEADITSGAVLRRFPTGVSLFHTAASLEDARRIMAAYLEAAKRAGS